jgi:hypothetical protein
MALELMARLPTRRLEATVVSGAAVAGKTMGKPWKTQKNGGLKEIIIEKIWEHLGEKTL